MVGSHGKTGLRDILDAQVVSLLGAKDLASIRGKRKLNMLDVPRQYTLFRILENITHYVVFLVQHQLFSMSYFNECSQS